MTQWPNAGWRGLAMLGAILLVIGLSLGDTGWAQVARAQTVPTLTFTPAPTLAGSPRPTAIVPTMPSETTGVAPGAVSATPPPDATPVVVTGSPSGAVGTLGTPAVAGTAGLAVCGPSPFVLSAAVRNAPVQLITGVGTVALLGSDALDDQSGAPVAVTRLSVEVIPNDQLPPAPNGWQASGCGLQATGAGASGQIAAFFTRGLVTCLVRPSGPAGAGPWRLAYFDARPGIGRWVFMPGRDSAGQLCSARFHLPAIFAFLRSAA